MASALSEAPAQTWSDTVSIAIPTVIGFGMLMYYDYSVGSQIEDMDKKTESGGDTVE